MGLLSDPTVRDFACIQRNFDSIARYVIVGNGTPENNLRAPRGAIFMRGDGGVGTSLYMKQSPASDPTGWKALT
jgi:hypothetical protein